jgi:predicted RNA-binding Zn ribbon-like protein
MLFAILDVTGGTVNMPKLNTVQVANTKKRAKAEVTKEDTRSNVFAGQDEGGLVVHWLNNPTRPANDEVEQLIAMEVRYQAGDISAGRETTDHINKMVGKWKFGMAPVADFSTLDGRTIVQRPVSDMRKVSPDQLLAFFKAVELMQADLLTRVRRCKREGCGTWFFAVFDHAMYHSEECRTKSASSNPEFRAHRRKYMRERRKRQTTGGKR